MSDGTIKKGTSFKLSVVGDNNFFYPGDNMFHASKDINYSRMSWTMSGGLRPIKVLTNDLEDVLGTCVKEKFSVIWIAI